MRQDDPLGGLRLGLALMTANGAYMLAGSAMLSGWGCSLAVANATFAARAVQSAIGLVEAVGGPAPLKGGLGEDNVIVLAERRRRA